MNRKGIKPRFRFGLDLPGKGAGYSRSFPFRRSAKAIIALAVMDVIFLIPLILTFRQASRGWGNFDSLFDLVITLFLSAWMLGWATAPIIMTTILLLMMFGREIFRARPGFVEVFIGLPGIGVTTIYDVKKIRNLRLEEPEKNSGNSWRGIHLVFDYGANPVGFGSAVGHDALMDLESGIATASGTLIGKGAVPAEDLQGDWDAEEEPVPVALYDAIEQPGPVTWTSPTSVALILANLVPVAGALFLGWSLADVMVLYWAESAVIGFFNLLKIIAIGRWGALFHGPFFLGHFGGFMSVHFLFIYTLFVVGLQNDADAGGDLANVWKLFVALWPALAALFISHAYSFFTNFLGRHEYRGKTMAQQMAEPYSRIIFMHVVLIFGGGLAMLLKDPAPVLLVVIVIKIYMDLKAHIKERSGKIKPAAKKKSAEAD